MRMIIVLKLTTLLACRWTVLGFALHWVVQVQVWPVWVAAWAEPPEWFWRDNAPGCRDCKTKRKKRESEAEFITCSVRLVWPGCVAPVQCAWCV